MSKLSKSFNKALQKELNIYAAWLPVTNTFRVGDYGLIEGGVFKSMGNIADKYPDIELKTAPGNKLKMDFVSSGTTMIKLDANGSAVDSFASLGDAEAKLKIQFNADNTSMIKAELTSLHLQNIDDVATRLKSKNNWKRKYKVVSTVYHGENCVIICSREAGTEVSISGSANILREVELGKVDGELGITYNKSSVFDAVGESGVVGLDLFKLNWLTGNANFLDETVNPEDVGIVKLKGALEDDF